MVDTSVAGLRALILELPGTPDRRLSPNSRTPGRTVSGIRRRMRDDAALWLRAWRNELGYFGDDPLFVGPTRIRVTVSWEKGRKTFDPDNLTAALKYLPDAMQREKLILNDRDLIWLPVRQTKSGERYGTTTIELGEVMP